MRVISGSLGGRLFAAPASQRVHPMGDKVRGSIFSTLGDLSGLSICDAYSGSGALSIEAISRGAKSAMAIEADPRAAKTISSNLLTLGLNNQVKLVKNKVETWLAYSESQFDVILADPPYDNLPQTKTLSLLASHLTKDGLAVLSWPGKHEPPTLNGLVLLKSKSFNDAQIFYYRHER